MCAPQSTAASAVGGGDSCDIFLWIVVNSLDKQMQNEKELIRLASAGVGGGAILYLWFLFLSGLWTSGE